MRQILEEVVDVFDEPSPQLQEETLDVIQPIPAERISVGEAPEFKHAPHGSCNWCSGNLVRNAQESTTSWTVPERSGRYDKVASAEVGSEVQLTVEVPPCQYIDRSVDIPVEMQRTDAWDSPQAHRTARVATRTCLALGVVEETSDVLVLVDHGPGHTCVSKHLRRETTLEDASEFDLSEEALGSPMDCVEDPSLFDLTKAIRLFYLVRFAKT